MLTSFPDGDEEDCQGIGRERLQHPAEQWPHCASGRGPRPLSHDSQAKREGGTGHRVATAADEQGQATKAHGGDQGKDVEEVSSVFNVARAAVLGSLFMTL